MGSLTQPESDDTPGLLLQDNILAVRVFFVNKQILEGKVEYICSDTRNMQILSYSAHSDMSDGLWQTPDVTSIEHLWDFRLTH